MTAPWYTSPVLRPLPCPGIYFHRRRFRSFDSALPHDKTRTFAASWFSVDDDREDFPSCHVVAEMDAERNVYIVDCVLMEVSLQDAVRTMFNMQEGMNRVAVMQTRYPKRDDIYGIRSWFCPREQQAAVEPLVFDRQRRLRKMGRSASLPLNPLPRPFDMDAATRSLQSEMISGRVLLPTRDPWVSAFLGELCEWPMVRHDARVRAMAVLMQGLGDIVPPGRAEVMRAERGSPWAA